MGGMPSLKPFFPNFKSFGGLICANPHQALVASMLDLGIGLGLVLAGFAFGYGAREVISYRRRQATIRRYHELGLDY
jgi:hypothetical protein